MVVKEVNFEWVIVEWIPVDKIKKIISVPRSVPKYKANELKFYIKLAKQFSFIVPREKESRSSDTGEVHSRASRVDRERVGQSLD